LRALPDHVVLSQVPLSRFIKVPKRHSYAEWLRRLGYQSVDFVVCEERATLIWLSQMAAFELHPSLSLTKRIDRPTALVFDLDPGALTLMDWAR
jgi:DNA primase